MEVHGNSHSEPGKLEQIVSQFLLKCLHTILDSRIPSLRPHDHSGEIYRGSRVRRSDKWFNMVLGDRPAALDNLSFWHRNIMDPMVIDIILVHQGVNSTSVDNLYVAPAIGATVETVIERWVVQYDTSRVVAPQVAESSVYYKKTYKKLIILLRSLFMQMRLLPAHRVFRQLSSSSQTYNFDIIYKVSSFTDPFSREEEGQMKEYDFAPVEAYPGRLCISVTYRSKLSDLNLEPSTSLPAKIFTDYVGSPTTDPLRSFPSIEKASFPLRGVRPQSSAFQRPHSWTSGFHKGAQFGRNQPLNGSPPVHRSSDNPYDFPSPPNDLYSNIQNYRPITNQKLINYDEYQLSPPFSPSASPSPPTYLPSGNPLRTRMHPESAPMTIPHAVAGKYSRYHVPNLSDSSRSSLPPPSPRSAKHDPSSQGSSIGSKSLRKSESLRLGEVNLGTTHRSIGQKVSRDSRDDSGRFSGLLSSSCSPRTGLSRSSSRLSFQDDPEDGDFSCPFDVDDVDPPIFQLSQNSDGEKASDFNSQSLPMGRQSADAAVGVLVHMLRKAPPLRQDSSCYSSSQSMKNENDGGFSTASGFFMPRKTSDALEELRSYKDMKNLLLSSRSGVRNNEARNPAI